MENEEVKTALYGQLKPLLKPDAILASNTSTISITHIGESLATSIRGDALRQPGRSNAAGRGDPRRQDQRPNGGDTGGSGQAHRARRPLSCAIVRDSWSARILTPYVNESLKLLEEGPIRVPSTRRPWRSACRWAR